MRLPMDKHRGEWVLVQNDDRARGHWYTTSSGADRSNKVHGANMGSIWGRQDPDGPHVGPTNFAIWGFIKVIIQ